MPRHRVAERLARYRKRKKAGFPVVISEGDSWFSYEFYPNIIDLVEDQEVFAHLRLEMSGDTVENMLGTPRAVEDLRRMVVEEEALFLLFSGGGNDIQRSAQGLFCSGDRADSCIVPERADELFDALRSRYAALIEAVGPHAPVVSHGYDHFQPSAEPVRIVSFDIGIGPWIHPEMVAVGIDDPPLQKEVADLLVDRFNDHLAELEAEHPDDFVYVDLRGTLEPGEWENEIHPTREGFVKVADGIIDAIYSRVREMVAHRRPR